MSVTVYTLEGCSYCKALLAELKSLGISYKNIDADKNPQEADRVEAIVKTSQYPIVCLLGDIYLASGMEGSPSPKVIEYKGFDHLIYIIRKFICDKKN